MNLVEGGTMDTAVQIIRRVSELLDERERQLAEAGEWRNVDWVWRQKWRKDAERIGLDLDRLGRGW